MSLPELIKTLPVRNELGEGVIWDSRRSAVWWTDIQNSWLYRYFPDSGTLEQWQTPERLCCFATVEGKDYLIAAFASGFAYYDPTTDFLEWIEKVDAANPNTRLNDGRADRQGRFWAGSMVEGSSDSGLGALYRLDRDLTCSRTLEGIAISNSLCWSPDSRTLYHTDTPSGRIDRYEFESQSGELGERATFAETELGFGPDGSCVDADGYVWNAQWGGSQIVRYSPEGKVDLILPVPATQPTCAAFGGAEMNLLFVTSATQDLDEQELEAQPEAGHLFIFQTGFKGLPDPEFRPQVP